MNNRPVSARNVWIPLLGFILQVSAFSPLFADTHYVDIASTKASAPYTNWSAAATVIQDAIDQAESNDTVLVTNGVYATGGIAVLSNMISRIAINKEIRVQSVNGSGVTVIKGNGPPGSNAVRCAYVGNGAMLVGFTLTNGATQSSGDYYAERSGGGVWCESSGVVSNCVIEGNSASYEGGGSANGRLYQCRLTGNTASGGGGSAYGSLYDCTLSGNTAGKGGGSYKGSLFNCTLIGNTANNGGGSEYGSLYNCMLVENTAFWGGGNDQGNLYNCTVIWNSATNGGGSCYSHLYNCITYFNTASNGNNYHSGSISYSCTIPLPTNGYGNITNNPQFVDTNTANYRLQLTSPCIDAGAYQEWMTNATDMAGNRRIVNGKVDMGAYEMPFVASPRVWLQGAYDTNQNRMATGLRDYLPLSSPYKADQGVDTAIPSNVTDWVLVQLRETNGNSIMSRSTFVNRDGYVLSDDGSTGLVVDVSTGTNCYLVLEHRNHLAVMSAQPLAFTNILTMYDFTTNASCYYGGSNAAVQIKSGVWGMVAGDADGDGKITETDRKIVEQQKGRTGYLPGDLNLDGVVE